MSIVGGIIGAVGSYIGGREQRDDTLDAQREQQQFLREGRERFEQNTPIMGTYMPGGANAFRTRQALLGLGGDPAQARQAFNNYLGSTDYKFRMGSGQRAITGSRAARGILNSGRTGTRLTDFGQELGSRYMDRYLGNLDSDSRLGFNAAQTYGNVITGNASAMAQGALQTGRDLADQTGSMWSGIGEGLGTIAGSFGGPPMGPAGKGGKPGMSLRNRFFGTRGG
jgi:hypothetical protein